MWNPSIELLLVPSFVNGSKLFFGRCLVPLRCREMKYVGLRQFFKEFHRLFQRLAGQGEVRIFNIEISGTKTSKPNLTLAFTQALITINTTQFLMSLRCIFPFSEVKKQKMTKMIFWNLHFQSTITFDWVNGWRYLYI